MNLQEIDNKFKEINLDQIEISQHKLNIEQKERSNLFPWRGQFSPQLIETLLSCYATKDSKIFDPFLGSGTVLIEAGIKNIMAVGTEINPAAFNFASTYKMCSINIIYRIKILEQVELSLQPIYDLYQDNTELTNIDKLVNEKLILQFSRLADSEAKNIFKTLLLLLDFQSKPMNKIRLDKVWRHLKQVILKLPETTNILLPLNRDARATGLRKKSFDLIITSPPYINVFNYHQNIRATSEVLGHDLLNVARSEIGSNRKHRGNRFFTVTQYILDMASVFNELKRICLDNARLIFIIGRESNVRKTKVFNSEIIIQIASECSDFKMILRQERVFTNRFGIQIIEDIIHFIPIVNLHKRDPYDIACKTLSSLLNQVPQESLLDLNIAIKKVKGVKPSPLYSSLTEGDMDDLGDTSF